MGDGNTRGGQPGGLPKVNLFKDAPTEAHAVPNQAPPVPPPVLAPPPATPAPAQAAAGQPTSGSGKRVPLIAIGVVVALVAAIALFAMVSRSDKQDQESADSAAGGVEASGVDASNEEQATTTESAGASTTTSTTTATTVPPPVAPAVDQSGNPIVDGWFILLSSALKGSAQVESLPGVAASNGGHVVDTDSYQTGFANDGRSGSLNEQAAVAPNYWPGSSAVAAVIGPFPDQFAAEEACRQRGAPLGNCVRQFRALLAAP